MTVSKYTTEVRFICESKSGLEESKGANNVDTIIANSWNKIFTTNCTFFDNNYRQALCSKILKHYYLREIGAETVGIWLLWMNTKLEEIMPYYNQLYSSALLEFNPFNDVNYTKEHEGENNGTKNVEGTSRSQDSKSGTIEDYGRKTDNGSYTDTGTVGNARDITVESEASSQGSKGDRYSDTPQGTIANTDVVGNAYLTNVRLTDDTTSGESSESTLDNNLETRNLAGSNTNTETTNDTKTISESDILNATNNVDETLHNTDSYIETIAGKMSTTPYSELLNKFRETFLNIDMMVIDEFDELFLRLW